MNTGGNLFEPTRSAFEKGDLKWARRCLFMAIRQDPGNITALLLLGWTASNITAQKYFFRQILKQQPENPQALDGIAFIEEQVAKSLQSAEIEVTGAQFTNHVSILQPGTLIIQKNEEETALPQTSSRRLDFLKQIYRNISYSSMFYLFLITIGETLFILHQPQIALTLQGVLFAMMILHAAYSKRDSDQKFLLSLSIAPLIRLLSLSLPMEHFPVVYWYMIVGIPLLIGAIYAARFVKMSPAMLGINGKDPVLQVFTALSGIGLGYIEFILLRPDPFVTNLKLSSIWIPILILFAFTGFLEEFIFRGMMQPNAVKALGSWGIVYIAFLYAILNIGNQSLPNLLFIFGVGLFFGLITLRTQSIIGVALSHGLTNIMLYLICPFVLAGRIF